MQLHSHFRISERQALLDECWCSGLLYPDTTARNNVVKSLERKAKPLGAVIVVPKDHPMPYPIFQTRLNEALTKAFRPKHDWAQTLETLTNQEGKAL